MAQVLEVAGGLRGMSGLARMTPSSTLNGPIGPHRRFTWVRDEVVGDRTCTTFAQLATTIYALS